MLKEQTNVISFQTRKPLLPFQIRAILMAQYATSKENDAPSELFVQNLEQRLLTAGAAAIVDLVRDTALEFLNPKSER